MASGHVNRIYRPNTWLHRPMLQNVPPRNECPFLGQELTSFRNTRMSEMDAGDVRESFCLRLMEPLNQ